MAIPEQVRKQSADVADLYKQLNSDTADEVATPDTPEAGAEVVVEDPADDEPVLEQTPAPEVEQTPGASDEDGDENSETYAQRWRSLQGSYNSAVRKIGSYEQRMGQMEQLLASLSESNNRPQQNPEPESYLSDDERSEYGDSIDVMRKVSREELGAVAQRLASIEQAVKQMQGVVPQVQNLASQQQASREQNFWSDLSARVPNWRDVNDSADFQNWLLDTDPLTGLTRQTYLEDAQRNLDADRVGAFFRNWLESNGQATPVAQSTDPKPSSELERQVAPGRSRGTGQPSSKPAKNYSPADIKDFYDDVRTGKYKGREKDRDRIEHDIFAAQREGRVVTT